MAAYLADDLLQLAALPAAGRLKHEGIQAALEFGRIGLQRAVLQLFPPSADGAGLLQQAAQPGREDPVARLDGKARFADEKGQAELMIARRPVELRAVAVGDPVFWTPLAEEIRDHLLVAVRLDDETGAVLVVEAPDPIGLLAAPGAGLVLLQDR